MGSLLIELVPSALGLVVTPAAIAAVILFLTSKRPVANAVAYASPFLLVYAGLAAVVLLLSAAATDPLISARTKHFVMLAVGLLLLGLAAWNVVRQDQSEGMPRRRPGWTARVESATPPMALGIGLVLAGLNPNMPILLAGLATVAAAEVSTGSQVVGAAFLVVASQVGLAGPILWYVLHPEAAARGLNRVKSWLAVHTRAVDLGVLTVFGTVFTVKGLAGL